MNTIYFILLTLTLKAFAHEGEHAPSFSVESGLYSAYSDQSMSLIKVEFYYQEPFFINSAGRVFKCDDEGYICTAQNEVCAQDDVIIAINRGFKYMPACGEEMLYFGLSSN